MMWMFERSGKKNPNNKRYQFRQQHNHPLELSDASWMMQKLEYIHLNPVKAGFVEEPEHFLYSSARNYAGMKGLIDVKFLY